MENTTKKTAVKTFIPNERLTEEAKKYGVKTTGWAKSNDFFKALDAARSECAKKGAAELAQKGLKYSDLMATRDTTTIPRLRLAKAERAVKVKELREEIKSLQALDKADSVSIKLVQGENKAIRATALEVSAIRKAMGLK